jgi:hypothetical protein
MESDKHKPLGRNYIMTTEQAAPAATAGPTGMEGADSDGRVFASSQTPAPAAPQNDSQREYQALVAAHAPQSLLDEFLKQTPDAVANSTLTAEQKEIADQFPTANPADIDLGFVPEQLAKPEGVAAKTQMETWITSAGAPKEMVQPFIDSVNQTAKTLATMPAQNREVHAKMEQDKAVRMCGGETAYKAQLADAKVFLQRLDQKSPGVLNFIKSHPEVIDNSAMTLSILFRMAALDKVRRGGQ